MKSLNVTIALVLFSLALRAQKPIVNDFTGVDKKAILIPDSLTKSTTKIAGYVSANFSSDKEKARAIFIWVATNIQYDIENMYALNFYETTEEKISKPLQTRKGICENYAALFTDICLKSGIKSYVIEGYTQQNGFSDYIPHAWCAVKLDSTWVMVDPTWGSGYVSNNKFYKKINNSYFSSNPAVLIKSHMPFDFLWQFLNYPVTNQEFYEGKTQQNKTKSFFSYPDSIQAYNRQDHMTQLVSSARRIEKNGIKNSMIFDRLQHIKREIEYDRQNKIVNLFNSAVADYNEGINLYNQFIEYRNKQFLPKKSDSEIKQMIDTPVNKINDAQAKLDEIKNPDSNTHVLITQLTKSIDDLSVHIMEQQEWLKLYLAKGKSARKSMFYKVTWFGIPLSK